MGPNQEVVRLAQQHAEALEREARIIAGELRPKLTVVKNWVKPTDMTFIKNSWGLISFLGVEQPVATGLGAIKMWRINHYMVTGLIQPRSVPKVWADFPILLRRVAIILGAPPDVIEMRNGVEAAKPKGEVIRDEADASLRGGSALVTTLDDNKTQSITFRWLAPPE